MAAAINLPRVLIVGPSAFNGITGTGITFSNLFREWPKDRLATVHNDQLEESHDVCSNYYRLGPAEIGRWPRLGAKAAAGRAFSAPAVLRNPTVRAFKKLLVGDPWPDTTNISAELERFIADMKPQLIYTNLGGLGMTQLVKKLRDRFGLPVAVHFLDDHLATLYRGGIFSAYLRRRLARMTDDIVLQAPARLAIGNMMADAFSARWNVAFGAVQNAVDVCAVPVANPRRDPAAPMRLAYIGSVFSYGQSESLADIAQAVARRASAGQRVSFDIYSPLHLAEPFRPKLEIHPAIRLHDTIHDNASFFRRLVEVDALVLPVNFDETTINYIRYSMPTKVPAYLASGTPILVYGPSETAQITYAEREGWGLVVNRRDPQALDQALATLQTDNDLRQRLSFHARYVAQRHDIQNVRREFQSVLAAAVPTI
jgi:hypothetical protein